MATTKLTLSMSEDAVKIGKKLAKESGTSLSKFLENYIYLKSARDRQTYDRNYIHPDILAMQIVSPVRGTEETNEEPRDYVKEYYEQKFAAYLKLGEEE